MVIFLGDIPWGKLEEVLATVVGVVTLVAAFPSGPENADATELAIWVNADVMGCIHLSLLCLCFCPP